MKFEDLTPISYDEAAKITGRVKTSLYNATKNGILTSMGRGPNKAGKLAKEQIELFADKEFSLVQLSHDEATIWHEVNRAIASHKSHRGKAASQLNGNTNQELTIITDLIDRLIDLSVDAIIELKANASKGLDPAHVLQFLLNSQAFSRIARLIGVDMDSIPDETMSTLQQALNESMAKAMLRLALEMSPASEPGQEEPGQEEPAFSEEKIS